ncbi:hypothetical protein EGR52_11825 [bacterium]|nr:hypothetical protein [bacterium]
MKDICKQIKEKQKLRNNLLDLGLICTLVGPTGPEGRMGKQGPQGEKGEDAINFPSSVESMFYTSYMDTKEEGLLTISEPWLIPNPNDNFEILNEHEILIKPGIYEITMASFISGVDNTHGGIIYLQDENKTSIKDLYFKLEQDEGKVMHFYQTSLLRIENDTKYSVFVSVLGDQLSSNVKFSNINLIFKKLYYNI